VAAIADRAIASSRGRSLASDDQGCAHRTGRKVCGLIAVADPIKDSTAEAIAQLKREGIKVVKVTGDNHATAEALARKLGIDFEADVLPEKKAAIVKKLQDTCATVAMAGDGVNDAPALAQADVGLQWGQGLMLG